MVFSKYLAREFIKIHVGLTTLFLLFYVVADFLDKNTRFFSKNHAPSSIILEYYAAQLPKIFVDVLPFTSLFAAIITMWIFARSGEISAVRASGWSVLRLSRPLIIISLILTILSFLIGEFVVPPTQLRLRYIDTVKISGKEYAPMFLDSKWVRGVTSVLHFEKYDPLDMVLYNPQYYVFSSPSRVSTFIYANKAIFIASTRRWNLENAISVHFDTEGVVKKSTFHPLFETSVESEPPRILRDGITSDQLSIFELMNLMDLSKRLGGNLSQRAIDLHQKISLPFANLLFVFFSFPFALRRERQGDAYIQIVLCLAVAISYWVGNATMKNLAQNGLLNPIIAAWFINIVFLGLAVVIVKKLD